MAVARSAVGRRSLAQCWATTLREGGPRVKRVGRYLVVALAPCVAPGCGTSGEPVVTAEITSASKMPFHGPGGPGSEPMSITFTWTVVVRSAAGPECQVDRIATELSEPQSRSEERRVGKEGTAQ